MSGATIEIRRLAEVAELLPSRSLVTDGDIPVRAATMTCINELGFNPAGVKEARMDRDAVHESMLSSDEILVSRSNTEELVGRAARYHGAPDRIVGTDLTIRVKAMDIDPGYLELCLTNLFLSGYWRKLAVGASPTMKKISRTHLLNAPLPVPSSERQAQLARKFAVLRAAVRTAKAAAAARSTATATLLDAMLVAAFDGVVPIAVGEDLVELPSGWNWRRLTDVARLESGHTPSRSRPDWWNGDIGWIALADIRKADMDLVAATEETVNEEGIANSSARVLPKGTVVMSRTASVGFVAQMARPMATSQDFVNWVCGPELDQTYLVCAIRASRKFIRSLSSGAIHQTVYVPTVKEFHVALPGRQVQEMIATSLVNRRRGIEDMKAHIDQQEAALSQVFRVGVARLFDAN